MIKNTFKRILPETLINIYRNILNSIKYNSTVYCDHFMGKYYYHSYSQDGEDMVLRSIFNNKPKGFYVDVGAHHPERFSNTYYFYKLGWRGINIDATPGSMKLFKKYRPRDINIEVAISDRKENLAYYIFNEPAVNTFSKENAAFENGNAGHFIIEKKNLLTYKLKDILDQYLPTNIEIDFISVDVEGFDLKVLSSNDWYKYRPRVVCVESMNTSVVNLIGSDIYRYLSDKGYSFVAKTEYSMVFQL